MTSMPLIDDRMVASFRRIGKRRASYRKPQASHVRVAQHVALQRSCPVPGQPCITEHGAWGWCENDHVCRINPFDPDNRFPRFL